ncbi:MAG TPA: hypothetical protein PKZ08_12050, partial [Vicinamibacterales bacterium]|nr:hypothetical protein [Vicinamibacterales bacterium]
GVPRGGDRGDGACEQAGQKTDLVTTGVETSPAQRLAGDGSACNEPQGVDARLAAAPLTVATGGP